MLYSIGRTPVALYMSIHGTTHLLESGAPCHTANSITDWLRRQGIETIGPWPGSSADLNPIENLWVMLKRKVASHNPTSFEDLKKVIKEVWVQEVSADDCRKLARSMPDRIRAVLEKKGLHTKY